MSIPLLIGIIGHRDLLDEYRGEVQDELSQALDEICSLVSNTPVALVSSLAEGADRLGARVGLAKGMELIVPLPFEVEVFQQDFVNSIDEFKDLLKQARCSFVAGESGFTGYEGASRWIARHCQVIIALWDGERQPSAPGGTAHTVQLRLHVGETGHTLSSVADYLGPVLHLHCPRTPGVVRKKPQWVWPEYAEAQTSSLGKLLSPLDAFNAEAGKIPKDVACESLGQLPNEFFVDSRLTKTFCLANRLANIRQRRFRVALKFTVGLAIIGYIIQHALTGALGKIVASVLLSFALVVIYFSNRARDLDCYLEYRALAEVLRVACFWRLAGLTSTPTDRFLNQHWGGLRWVRSAVNALWIPDTTIVPDLEVVKAHWIDDQKRYFEKRSADSEKAARYSRSLANACFAAGVFVAWLGVFNNALESFTTLGSGILLIIVGAVSHYAHTCGWEEDASRYKSMAAPFFWCQQIWQTSDKIRQRVLIQELGGECIAEISNWLLTHRDRPIGLFKG